jgi:putative oxidoreductase
MIRAVGLPLPPLALAVAVVVELGGGLLLVSGFWTRAAATALALFSLVTAIGCPVLQSSGHGHINRYCC